MAQSLLEAQEVLQAVAPQTYALQVCVWTAGHDPPLHEAASVAVPLVHEAPRHCVEGYAQEVTVTPSQLPPQEVPSVAQAVRLPCGAPVTGLQTPTMPATSHAWHSPPQAELQQTPSTQLPFPHWALAEQVPPSAIFGTHWLEALQ